MWRQTLEAVYGEAVDVNSFDYIMGRAKIFDNVKAYKGGWLKKMEVNYQITVLENAKMLINLRTMSRSS